MSLEVGANGRGLMSAIAEPPHMAHTAAQVFHCQNSCLNCSCSAAAGQQQLNVQTGVTGPTGRRGRTGRRCRRPAFAGPVKSSKQECQTLHLLQAHCYASGSARPLRAGGGATAGPVRAVPAGPAGASHAAPARAPGQGPGASVRRGAGRGGVMALRRYTFDFRKTHAVCCSPFPTLKVVIV